jgi:GDP-L-fucose synthase
MRILLTGANGLLGRAIQRVAPKHYEFRCPSSKEIDLRNRWETRHYFNNEIYDCVIHCASKVAGLGGHKDHHAQFLNDNVLMNSNVTEVCAFKNDKLIAVSSVAAFPGNLSYLTEDAIEEGPVHDSELGYAISKRLLDTQIQLYREEYGSNFCCLFPTNVYGPEDNFNLQTGHVIPSLIHKFRNAREEQTELLRMWGDGHSLRQFIYVDDLARIILGLAEENDLPHRMICSEGTTYSIRQVAQYVGNSSLYKGIIMWENSKQKNGLRVRECDNSRMKEFCRLKNIELTPLTFGLYDTVNWFEDNYESARK